MLILMLLIMLIIMLLIILLTSTLFRRKVDEKNVDLLTSVDQMEVLDQVVLGRWPLGGG